ncbi:BlaI/MecI/CopY family transcriptional regulator [Paenibacillus oenotherae]|uniref:BlaI/MecI/CopY family transcriptional regulator n=1 Tax=Paenibacillus oenotherae TaxID=1435645 RepID=A0ABS7DB58_9BACL|nr:BlaI/MecI/CopY family transcriptional regulator [Paenibacillus oenotherae]MBW7476393.1 BlaI/MecI/CopY family transcriptional regulator [Paenibacillus oenotherae]
MAKQVPRISDAEWEVMKVLWSRSPLTASDVVKELEGSKEWNPKTVRTLIKRLVEKEAVSCNPDGRNYLYAPLVREDECVRSETSSLLQRIYGGAMKPMLVNFLKDERLTKEDIAELKAILEQRKE